jgi:hypothetical protein
VPITASGGIVKAVQAFISTRPLSGLFLQNLPIAPSKTRATDEAGGLVATLRLGAVAADEVAKPAMDSSRAIAILSTAVFMKISFVIDYYSRAALCPAPPHRERSSSSATTPPSESCNNSN